MPIERLTDLLGDVSVRNGGCDMRKPVQLLLTTFVCALAAIAQTPVDAYQVRYVANISIGDSLINMTNAGSLDGFDPAGNICANVYVFSQSQQLVACCTCPLSPNH